MRGGHFIKSWSSTQKNITLSSGEAELIAAVKASCETIGALQLTVGWGEEMEGSMWMDSSAALGMVRRKGNGQMRHVRIGNMWIQEREENEQLKFNKIDWQRNPSDAMTKNLNEATLWRHCKDMHMEARDGRAKEGLELT